MNIYEAYSEQRVPFPEHDCHKSPDSGCMCDDREALDKFIDEEERKTERERKIKPPVNWNVGTSQRIFNILLWGNPEGKLNI